MEPFRRILLAVFVLVAAASCIRAPYPHELMLQHIPTVVAVAFLAGSRRFAPMSRQSFVLLVTFMALHVIGARWIYSYVPYDDWSVALTGINLSKLFGWRRNHYDRLVHFAYGLLLTPTLRELLVRRRVVGERAATWSAITLIAASSMLYELFEWLLAVVLSPNDADQYNGQQGDVWDAQKDMALALAGSLITGGLIALRQARARQNVHS